MARAAAGWATAAAARAAATAAATAAAATAALAAMKAAVALVAVSCGAAPLDFLTLQYEAYSRASSYNGRSGNCVGSYDAGDLDTEIRWTKLAWLDEDLLQINALDTTYATVVSGSGKFYSTAVTLASGNDCAGSGSTRGEGVIDLRGTPYVIAGVNDTPCYKTAQGSSGSICFQWKAHGWNAAVSVTCSDGNQRCVVRGGGYSGRCRPINNMLQLAWKPPTYTLMSDALSWGDADAACLAANMQLASVHSAAQNALLVTAAAGNSVWMGGTDAASEGTWLWSPSNTPLSYTNWYAGEPNNALGGEHCLVAYYWGGTWNDDGCTKKKKYVCQLPIY